MNKPIFLHVKLSTLVMPILLLVCIFCIANTRLFGNLMVFDVIVLVFVVSYFLIHPEFRIKKRIFEGIMILNICMVPCTLLLLGAAKMFNSVMFVAQNLMIINVLPIFILILQDMNLIHKFNRLLLCCFVLNGILFVVFWFLFQFVGLTHFLYFSNLFFGRITFGDFVPNDIAYFVILGLFLVDQEFNNPRRGTFSIVLYLFRISSHFQER